MDVAQPAFGKGGKSGAKGGKSGASSSGDGMFSKGKSSKGKGAKRMRTIFQGEQESADQESGDQVSLLQSNVEYRDAETKVESAERDDSASSGSSLNSCLRSWTGSFAMVALSVLTLP